MYLHCEYLMEICAGLQLLLVDERQGSVGMCEKMARSEVTKREYLSNQQQPLEQSSVFYFTLINIA